MARSWLTKQAREPIYVLTLPTLSVTNQQSIANYVSPLSFLGEAESTSYDLPRLQGAFKSPISYSNEKPGVLDERWLCPQCWKQKESFPCMQLKTSQIHTGDLHLLPVGFHVLCLVLFLVTQ